MERPREDGCGKPEGKKRRAEAAEAKRKFAGTCYKCEKSGHRARDCEVLRNVSDRSP